MRRLIVGTDAGTDSGGAPSAAGRGTSRAPGPIVWLMRREPVVADAWRGVELDGAVCAELFKNAEQATSLQWGCAPATFAASKTFRRAIGVDVIEGWLDCSLLQHPFLKVFLDGRQLPAPALASTRSVAGQTVTGFVDALKTRAAFAEGATLMFCTTTPVPNNLGSARYAFRTKGAEKDFNSAAREVLRDYPEIQINDLAGVVNKSGVLDNWRKGRDVHFWKAHEQAVVGKAVGDAVVKALKTRERDKTQ